MAPQLPKVPDGWSLTSFMLHNESELAQKDAQPFAPMMLVQQRIDVAAGVPATDVLAGDVVALQEQLPGFTIKSSGYDEATKLRHLEFEHEAEGRQLTQLVLYVSEGERLFTVTLTARSGAQFEKLRPQALAFARGRFS
jgi:hypothetical protein